MTAVAGGATPFGALLRRSRLDAGLTQEALAERASLSVRAVSDLERGLKQAPRFATVRLLAVALGLAPGEHAALTAAARRGAPGAPGAPARNNLPARLTSFVGRERELAEVRRLLDPGAGPPGPRLLSLTGPGGVGKTRLALEAAASLTGAAGGPGRSGARGPDGGPYPDGVWVVELGALADPALVPRAVAQALGVREESGRMVPATLADALRPRRMLLVLDNCEHLVAGVASLVARLLASCPGLTVLATSREVLRLSGEHAFPVPPLALPEPGAPAPPGRRAPSAAVRLFVERARAAGAGVAPTAGHAPAVAAICRRLDGLPLALELAAARVRALPPPALLARLERRLPLLTGGHRDAPARQQTLEGAIAWSHDLLSQPERVLFRRLAVFAGGCTLDAAEAVCASGPPGSPPDGAGSDAAAADVLGGLAALVDKSLVWMRAAPDGSDGEPRYGMLETIREFALDRLAAAGEAPTVRARHAAHYEALAEAAAAHADPAGEEGWLARLDSEVPNVRAALRWLEASGAPERVARLAGTLRVFWQTRGLAGEGLGWLERALAGRPRAETPQTAEWAEALDAAGTLALFGCDYARAAARFRAALEARRALGDRRGAARALQGLATLATRRSEYDLAESLYQEALSLQVPVAEGAAGAAGAELAETLFNLGVAAFQRGDHDGALARYRGALARWRAAGSRRGVALCHDALGGVAEERGDHRRARAHFEAALEIRREAGDRPGVAASLGALSIAARLGGDYRRAVALAREAVALTRGLADPAGLAYRLYLLCLAATAVGDPALAREAGLEALALERELGTAENVARRLEGLAAVVHEAGGPGAAAGAARLLGAAAALREAIAAPPRNPEAHRRGVEAVRAHLTPGAFARAWAGGRSLTPERAVAEAFPPADGRAWRRVQEQLAPPAPMSGAPAPAPGGLTRREREVAALVARGLTNREIAAALLVTGHTAERHVEHILGKLGLRSRTQVAAWAVAHDVAGGAGAPPG